MARRRLPAILLGMLLLAGLPAASQDKEKPKRPEQPHYGLIFGTAYGPDNHPLYGAKVEMHPAGQKHPRWELVSDHRGEFAQRVPPGPGDYELTGQAEVIDPQTHKKKRVKGEAKVHLEGEERQDVSLHLMQ